MFMFCQALKAFCLSAAGSARLAVGAAPPRGKLEKRSAPVLCADAGCGGLCHVPGCVLLGGGGYAEAAWYGFPLGAGPPVAPPEAFKFGYSPARRLSASYLVFCSSSPKISCAVWIAWNLGTNSSSFPALRSGWYCRASLRYCFFTSSIPAEVGSSRSASAGWALACVVARSLPSIRTGLGTCSSYA